MSNFKEINLYEDTLRDVLFFEKVIVERKEWPERICVYDFYSKQKIDVNIKREKLDLSGKNQIFDTSTLYTEDISNLKTYNNYYLLYDDYTSNIAHLMFDVFTKMYHFQFLKNEKLKIVHNLHHHEDEFLLDYTHQHLNEFPDRFIVENFYLPSPIFLLGCDHQINSKLIEQFKSLKNKLLNINFTSNSKRLYISRQDIKENHWHKRKLINECSLIEILKDLNFEIVTFSDKSMSEKINLIHRSDIVITLSGATSYYFQFIKPKTKCFVIQHPTLAGYENILLSNLIEKFEGSFFSINPDVELIENFPDLNLNYEKMGLPWKIKDFDKIKEIIINNI